MLIYISVRREPVYITYIVIYIYINLTPAKYSFLCYIISHKVCLFRFNFKTVK